ncbi:TPA: type I DNA topoisomerase [Aeromonas salmonicida]|uniref:DNA topoisomerase 1 n=2 Tax=Aeromonas salmonicida subsp. salmonicida TaxID=29491 RepID=A4SQD3_AERS4|nr:type I DNA topoisomerase [Aeromonas salmonicida]ABO91105.1 DNA topoisomerase I [Aeromonas salmonicida subsp. salmonicida A449]AYO64141.1 type I DNA topoisomerase [Aeromonas salmonicida subsp. salmonicida 01-B526]EHI53407.1 DNA topoisomerase I subunit omega [Aeromonas salmonicida subsp. salmonicida 01-B526]EKP0237854.1 type I DNA topoisomerase [Aeromonas salmonicida]EKP0242034.1 type I DNA topoisomerase [Aeromonas salmonicida]
MGKSLVIVESPAKAKTINKYLGKDYVVKSSVGHVRDLPTSGSGSNEPKKPVIRGIKLSESEKAAKDRNALFSRMGINPTAGWQANYQILPGKEKVVSELQSLAAKADTIYLATDLDREGEAIAWHLREIIGGDDSRYKRVVFNEITKTAIQEAFAQPSELNIHRVNAQQARRFLDRVVGYMVSPLLWKKLARGLSAGRVQSVAVRLIVDKEREIKAFVPVEFWDLNADLLTGDKSDLRMEVVSRNGADFKPVTQAETFAAVAALEGVDYKVVNREDKPTGSKPSAPFITSTLQQAASTRLSFGVKKTMMMAQRLYEAGYITYMRTDSTNLSKEAVEALREYIGEQYGAAYLPAEPNLYGSKAGAQEAHEAIRPSSVLVTAEMLEGMEPDAMRLYDLIWRQFVACQMTPAQYDSSTLTVKAGEFELKARGRTLRFAGWTKALPPMGRKGEDSQLPAVTVGEVLKLIKLDPRQHFTKPPARFTEAALVRELEKRGIGRPSTYASIISTIVDRGYVRVESRRFFAEKMGEIVTDRLVENFVELMNYEFTAKMEDKLDGIAEGSLEWKKVLDAFYEEFTQELAKADRDAEEGGMRANQMVLTDIDCPDCGRKMGIRTATTGVFLGCSGYALPPKERCKKTINLVSADEFVSATDGDEAETEALRAKHRCGVCGTAMDAYIIDDSRKLHVCGRNPDCDGYEIEKGQFKLKGYEGPSIECDRCGSEMQLKNGRFGKYMGCTNETCKNTRKILKNGDIAPPKEDPVPLPELKCTQSDAYFVLRDGAAGLFLAASNFPKSRETRAPLVEELKRFKERLSPKHQYLADAPASDPDGNASIVRFSRKTKEQYVMTEVNGKATGWTAHYDNGKWQESLAKSKKA